MVELGGGRVAAAVEEPCCTVCRVGGAESVQLLTLAIKPWGQTGNWGLAPSQP